MRAEGEVREVCVVLLSGLGDVVHGLPVVNALKRDDPTRRITWVVEPLSAPLLRGHPAVDEVIVFEKKRGLRGVLDLARAMRRRRWDLALNFNIYFKSVFPTVFSRARVRVGLDRGRSADGVWLFANLRTPARFFSAPVMLECRDLDSDGQKEILLAAVTDHDRVPLHGIVALRKVGIAKPPPVAVPAEALTGLGRCALATSIENERFLDLMGRTQTVPRQALPAESTVEPRCGSGLAVPASLVGWSEPGYQAKGGEAS